MYKFLLIALFSTQAFAADIIKNGKMTISYNNVETNSTSCSTYEDGDYQGIVSYFGNNVVLGSYEFDTSAAEIISESPRTYLQKVAFVNGESLCATQSFLNNLEIRYSTSQDQTTIEYSFRCNQQNVKRTITCKAI